MFTGRTSSPSAPGRATKSSGWSPTNPLISWLPQAPRPSPSSPCILMVGTRSTSTRWANGSSASRKTTSGGRLRTLVGSSDTATSCMRRSSPAARRSRMKAGSIIRAPKPSIGSSRRTPSPESSLRRPPPGLLMKYGTAPARKHNLGSLKRVVCAGEVLNAPAWEWLQLEVLENKVPVIDHMWQTETGGPIFGNTWGLGLLPIKPGSGGIALPGVEAMVVSPEGDELPANEKGMMVIKRPFPGLTATLWGEVERYANDYWRRIPGKTLYLSGDASSFDEDGYVWFSGRAVEIIMIAGHRIVTIEVETAFLRHPGVAEAGVTARPDPVRMEVIAAFVVLKKGYEASDELRKELLETVRHELGPVAVIGDLNFVTMLPKTRSGKIMRRVLKAVTLDKDPGDISTIEDAGSVQDAREAWEAMRKEVTAGH